MQVCPNCGEENPERFRLCGFCGTKLAPDLPAQDVRKTVSIIFSDLKGSTSLGESLDTEALREVLHVYFEEMKGILERHGGTVEKFIGDAIMAVFGLPRIHEDDALRAVRAAAEMREALVTVNERLEKGWGVRLANRTGVYTGEVVAGDVTHGQRLVTGDTANVAARLEQNAPENEILIGEPTYRLVKDAVEVEEVEPLELKGKAERVPAYRLISVRGDEGVARRHDLPLVGREDELAVLNDALARAISDRRAELVTVFGPAGAGKSRLLRELIAAAGVGATALRGHCLSYGEGITFWPLAEVMRAAARAGDDDPPDVAWAKLSSALEGAERGVLDRLAAVMGLSSETFPVQETFWAARRALEMLARKRALIIFFDDIHWAEQTFLDLIRDLVVSASDAPILIACSSRGDLIEEHPDWGQENEHAKVITLNPLSEADSAAVIENVLGTAGLDAGLRGQIVAAAEGNPLFVEQMLSMLIDDGILTKDSRDCWVAEGDVGTITIPPTISALLTARLDRLAPTERVVLEHGSVIGQVFFPQAVQDLVPETASEHVPSNLGTLTRKEMIRPNETIFGGQETYRFVHILIREAAYNGILKRQRADLHERFVDWLERVDPGRELEFAEIRGYHLEQAHLISVELSPIDDHGRSLGSRAAEYLSMAGHRALERGDLPAAANLLKRAATVLPSAERMRVRLLLDAGEALLDLGEFKAADDLLVTAIAEAESTGDRPLATTASVVRLRLHYVTEAEGTGDELIAKAKQAITELEKSGDHHGLARAWRLIENVNWATCRFGAAEEAVTNIVEHARAAGDRVLEARVLPSLAAAALYGPTPVPQAIARCEDILERTGGDRKAEALVQRVLAHLEAMQGNADRARELYRQSRTSFEELGWNLNAAITSIDSGPVEMLSGDAKAAERELRRDYHALDRMGERNYISTIAGYLAEAMYEQGAYDEAFRYAEACRDVAATDDVSSQFLWRCVFGKVLAQRGELAESERLLIEAVDIIRTSDDPDSHGNALMDLAEVLQLAGDPERADLALKEALDLFEQKGNLVSAHRARALLEQAIAR